MSASLRFRTSYAVDVVDSTKLFLHNEEQSIVVDDPVAAKVATRIDGDRDAASVILSLRHELSPEEVFVSLRQLTAAGHLLEVDGETSPLTGFVEAWGISPTELAARASAFPIRIVDLCGRSVAPDVAASLVGLGAPVHDISLDQALADLEAAGLVLVVVDDYLRPELARLNEHFLNTGQMWMPVKAWGREIWVGPRFVPGSTGCWACAADRLTSNRQVERYIADRNGGGAPRLKPVGLMPGAGALAGGLVTAEVLAVAMGRAGSLAGRMTTRHLVTLEAGFHQLVRRPQCPACGTDEGRSWSTADIDLPHVTATHRKDGGYRVCTPERTLERLEHHVSPHLGAVSKLSRIRIGGEEISYAYAAGHNFGMMADDLALLKTNMRGQSGGKGRTDIQAKVSGLCEALERFCGVWTPDVPKVRTTYQSAPARAIHPRESLLFSEAQYAAREAINADPRNKLHRVPELFADDREFNFTPARSLTTGEEVLIPSGLVWFGEPDLRQVRYAVTDSNGGAAGNTLHEAILQGLCEVYERDAVALWWYNRSPRPAVDLASFEDEYTQLMTDYYDSIDRDLWVLDLSNDLSVPVFAAFSRRRHEVEDLMVGFGAHPDADIALFRALTELNQFLPFVATRDEAGNTVYGTDDPATVEWCRTATTATQPWVAPSSTAASTKAGLARELPTDLRDLVDWCVDDLRRAGMETLVVNQSRPDIELAVTKVFVPGMRHFWKRFAPGRLYDTPVRLGWTPTATPETELNPIGVYF